MKYFHQETVRENMTRPARTVDPEMTLGDLLRLFSANDCSAYPVVHDGKLAGIASRANSIKPFTAKAGTNTACFDAIMGTTVDQIMSWHVITVELDATLDTVVHLMGVHDFESFPVVDQESRVRGVISREDVIRALARYTWRGSTPLPLSPMGYAIA